jgi:hypothetical protein
MPLSNPDGVKGGKKPVWRQIRLRGEGRKERFNDETRTLNLPEASLSVWVYGRLSECIYVRTYVWWWLTDRLVQYCCNLLYLL